MPSASSSPGTGPQPDRPPAGGSVSATPRALELIERLAAEHGPLVFLQSGGCCGGSEPICLRRGDLMVGPGDLLIGSVAGADFYIDREMYERWNRPELVIDAASGAGDTFSIEGLLGMQFLLAGPTDS